MSRIKKFSAFNESVEKKLFKSYAVLDKNRAVIYYAFNGSGEKIQEQAKNILSITTKGLFYKMYSFTELRSLYGKFEMVNDNLDQITKHLVTGLDKFSNANSVYIDFVAPQVMFENTEQMNDMTKSLVNSTVKEAL